MRSPDNAALKKKAFFATNMVKKYNLNAWVRVFFC